MIWLYSNAFLDDFAFWTRMMGEEKMLAEFFSVDGVEEAWVLGLDEKNII